MIASEPKVFIFDIHNKTMQESIRLAEQSKKDINNVKLIALSRTGTYYAQWRVYQRHTEPRAPYQESRLIIKNALSGKVEFLRYLLSEETEVIFMGFNKQGTKVVVHAHENILWENIVSKCPMSPYYIFSLTTPEEHEKKSEKTLEAYLRNIGCCKNLASNSLITTGN